MRRTASTRSTASVPRVGRYQSWVIPAGILVVAVALTWGDWGTLVAVVVILVVLEVLHRLYIHRSVDRSGPG